ncbi:alanine--tRNA ligase [Aegicerativicinus sediminis]|uniref:alanine--tRNA ligase n=1 Tax=Aegicerativicinus sediminis TaxID=2893202 RepID=UPI001E3EB505|nr:alanine--tRNA ligase [Aegicerativicinus sediminis]
MKSKEIRETFLDFFKNKEHKIVPSSPMVVKDDPTLMFINSGMAPFKEYFLGNGKPPAVRIADTQKCLRVSGKHNDLEEVGYDTYHHTFFEMMGNWSFGDYFKKEAIEWAWELLTEVFKISKDQLYVTVFEGSDDEDKLPMDEEAYAFWSEFVSPDRILKGNKKDNFWEMGDQGPCGPCSEIHVDIRPLSDRQQVSGSELVNKDHPQVVEIWNLVFMQYNRKANGSLEPLPEKHIDTGMGFERLCMVLQQKTSNYDTDVFTPLIEWLEDHTNIKYGSDEKSDIAMRVVCDHIRTVAFAIADGQLPSNTGAGYVIRRILRRAIRYGFTFLKQEDPFMFKLVNVLSANMGDAFPELKEQQHLIENVIREEEHAFLRTLEQGLSMLNKVMAENSGKSLSGTKVFELYDTFGFPADLTALILRENGLEYDHQGFEKAMKEQKDRSRAAGESKTGDWIEVSSQKEEGFVGYDQLTADVKILRYRKVESKKDGVLYQLVFNKTPFYPEGGGQVGDKGYLEDIHGDVVYILDTKKENNVVIHFSKNLPNHLEELHIAVVENQQRFSTECNHSATHLLHQALREILGTHVEQKGSSVHSKQLRFDFSHFSKVSQEELQAVEDFVNKAIKSHFPLVEQRNIPMQKAIEEGAMALFGEKYGDKVRTIRFGDSIELCGGTHVKNTSDIWYFKILSESAVAAGVRRIEAITGEAVKDYFKEQEKILEQVKQLIGNQKSPIKAFQDLQEVNNSLQKEIEQLKKAMAGDIKGELKSKIEQLNGINFLAENVDLDPQGVKDVCYELGNELDNLFILLGSENNGKAMLTCYISKEVVADKKLNAGTIVRELGKYIQGGGGGQPFFATAGGKNVEGIAQALEAVRNYIN